MNNLFYHFLGASLLTYFVMRYITRKAEAERRENERADRAPTIQKVAMGAKPDPHNFTVLRWELVQGNTIVLALYPGSLTFHGQKLMLLRGEHTEFTTLDPHFLDEEYAVVARFIPTDKGWEMARMCAANLADL